MLLGAEPRLRLMQASYPPYVERLEFRVIVPRSFHEGIQQLCEKLGTGTEPMFLSVSPKPGTTPNQCFRNVQSVIETRGGEPQYGWLLWEAPGILLEAEFHCAWQTPERDLVCISARLDAEESLAFLPDPLRRFEGVPLGNVAIAWPSDPFVAELLDLESSFQQFKNLHFDPITGTSIYSPEMNDRFVRRIERATQKIKVARQNA